MWLCLDLLRAHRFLCFSFIFSDFSYWSLSGQVFEARIQIDSTRFNSIHQVEAHTYDVHTRQRLRSASSSDLMAPRTIHSTIGEQSFQLAAASTWNALPRSVRSSTSVLQF